MEIRERIKDFLFHRCSTSPIIETSRRIPIPDGFLDGYKTVCASELRRGNERFGARLYSYSETGVDLQKNIIGDKTEEEWQQMLAQLQDAKQKGYIESTRTDIPSSLSDGKRGVYALDFRKYDDINKEFVPAGAHIYQTDEKGRAVLVRTMGRKVWNNYRRVIDEAIKQEKALRRSALAQFDVNTQK